MKLSIKEYEILCTVASKTKMDCWFIVYGDDKTDWVFDLENNKRLLLSRGVQDLMEGIAEARDFSELCGLTNNEIGTLYDLLVKLRVPYPFPKSEVIIFEFEYGGYKFRPHRRFTPKEIDLEFAEISQLLRADPDIKLRTYDGTYAHDDFYKASDDSVCDIFRCLDNDKLYVPGDNELFVWEGDV